MQLKRIWGCDKNIVDEVSFRLQAVVYSDLLSSILEHVWYYLWFPTDENALACSDIFVGKSQIDYVIRGKFTIDNNNNISYKLLNFLENTFRTFSIQSKIVSVINDWDSSTLQCDIVPLLLPTSYCRLDQLIPPGEQTSIRDRILKLKMETTHYALVDMSWLISHVEIMQTDQFQPIYIDLNSAKGLILYIHEDLHDPVYNCLQRLEQESHNIQ